MIYNLYLTKDYCLHWKKEHALKELIMKVKSKNGTVTLRSDSCLVLETPNSLVSPEDVLFGKGDKHPFDKLGEGLILAILTLLREDTKFYFLHHLPGFTCLNFLFNFRKSSGLEEETLHVKAGHLYEHPVRGAIFEIFHVSQEEFDRINDLDEQEFMTKDKELLKSEYKQMQIKMDNAVAEFDGEVKRVLSKVFSPAMMLTLHLLYSKEKIQQWIEKDEIESFVQQFLQKENVDINTYTNDEKIYKKVIDSICSYCYYFCYGKHKYHK